MGVDTWAGRPPLDPCSPIGADGAMNAAPADSDRDRIAEIFGAIALVAGRVVMDIYAAGAQARLKPDSSPVCDADEAAEAAILAALARELPGVPVVAEESVAKGVAPQCGERFILVDPLDGTREFLAGNGEFTVNLALVENGAPVAGAVYAPVQEKLWLGGATASLCKVAPGAALPPPARGRASRRGRRRPTDWSRSAAGRTGTPRARISCASCASPAASTSVPRSSSA